MIFAKIFSAMFDGSMYGAGADVFAVWVYLLAKCDYTGHIEVNARKIAGDIGTSVESVDKAIAYLEQPDPRSRSTNEEGRRIVREGQFLYRIVNFETYRDMRDAEAKREYDRNYQRKRYQERKTSSRKTYEKTRDSSHIDKDLDKEKPSTTLVNSPSESTPLVGGVARVVETWNRITGGKLPRVAKVTSKRERVIKARLKEQGWLEDFETACAYVSESDFYLGKNDRGWTATIDFLLRPNKAAELAEKSSVPAVTIPAESGGFDNELKKLF